jgi:peptidyl-tRNA hydrolase
VSADDPWVMYLVVRKDQPLRRGQAMALAGGAAVRCADELAGAPRWAGAFAAWSARPRKVALRAGAGELEALRAALDAVAVETGPGLTLLCLPPRRRSAAEPALAALRPYTDPPRPRGETDAEGAPAPDGPPLRYVVRRGVLRTTGKAMAQAGHGALECVRALGEERPPAWAAWRAAGRPGEVRMADPEQWGRVRAAGGVVVSDAGLTQVAPGTETVAAFPPAEAPPGVVRDLPVLP